jgi:hypothetical protein
MIDVNKEAEEYLLGFRGGEVPKSFDEVKQIYIAGHNSKATQAKIIQAKIEVLNSLDTELQAVYKVLPNITRLGSTHLEENLYAGKKSGIGFAQKEIKKALKELQQQFENE